MTVGDLPAVLDVQQKLDQEQANIPSPATHQSHSPNTAADTAPKTTSDLAPEPADAEAEALHTSDLDAAPNVLNPGAAALSPQQSQASAASPTAVSTSPAPQLAGDY